MYTLMESIRETISRPLGGAAPWNFTYALEIDQGNLVHTPTATGVPPKNVNRENWKSGLKFSVLDSITSGLVGVSSRDFFQSTSREAEVIKCAQFLQCPPPKISDGKKSSKIFRNFWQLSTLIANISGKDQRIKNLKSSSSSTTPPTVGEKSLAYFGPQTKKLLTLMHVHPNGLFYGRLYIGR